MLPGPENTVDEMPLCHWLLVNPHWLVGVASTVVCISSESSAGGLDTVASGGLNYILDM